MAGLEDDVDELRRRQTDDRASTFAAVDELRSEIAHREAEQESERARQLGRRLRYEELGVFVFVLGVALTTVGSAT